MQLVLLGNESYFVDNQAHNSQETVQKGQVTNPNSNEMILIINSKNQEIHKKNKTKTDNLNQQSDVRTVKIRAAQNICFSSE